MNWGQIPIQLRRLPQWAVAGPDKRPYHPQGYAAASNDPKTWSTFEAACAAASMWGSHVGFMMSSDTGYACIDLDVKPDTDAATNARLLTIVATFDSFTERSASGRGYHIWVRAVVGAGARRDNVEVYDRERFMICTGDVYVGKDIADRQELVTLMVSDMRNAANAAQKIELEEVAAVEDDNTVMTRATGATNCDKFNGLWAGDWAALGYTSQSEADLSLLSMLCFYTTSNAQVRSLFRMSGLGKRDKATKNNVYLDRTLTSIRSRQARETAVDNAAAQSAKNLVDKYLASNALRTHSTGTASVLPTPQAVNYAAPMVLSGTPSPNQIPWPPGLMGEVAQWLYSFAPRPVREVAIVTALGFYAGICGRAFHISNSGLNLYIVLVGRSGVGKEAMHSGMSKLVYTMLNNGQPEASQFIDFADYASGPALIKSLTDRASFVNVAGEWGRKLKKMSDDHNEGPMSSLRTAMTNLYQKSSAGTIVGGIGYSDKEKDVKAVNGVAYSMIGETTPETFYESLTNTMMQDGFMSRFVVIEYEGLRPELNIRPPDRPREELVSIVAGMASQCLKLSNSTGVPVYVQPEAQALFDSFNAQCDQRINSSDDESWRQMWNRAHLKVLKVAALLAVADNYILPVLTVAHAEWALELIGRDIAVIQRKMESGDVGDGDMVREKKLLAVIRAYLQDDLKDGYGLPPDMKSTGIVARKFLQIRVQRVNSFLKHRNGAVVALDTSIRSLIDSGYLLELPKDKIPAAWGYVGKCYRVVALPEEC